MKIFLFFLVLSFGLYSQAEKPLFERLGGDRAVASVVKETVANIKTDESIRPFFAVTFNSRKREKRFMKLLYLQICEAAGGGCKYPGKDMKTAHKGMGVRKQHFQALAGALVKALDKFKVPEKEKNELLAAVGPLEKDIVEPK